MPKTLLILTAVLGGLSLPAALVAQKMRPAPNDVVWTTPSKDANGSMPLGNGDIGLNAWVEPDGDLVFYISKTDSWSDNGRLLKVGRLRVSCDPPLSVDEWFEQRLDLDRGAMVVCCGNPTDFEGLRLWVDANRPVIHIEVLAPSERTVTAAIELWRTERTPYLQSECSDLLEDRSKKSPSGGNGLRAPDDRVLARDWAGSLPPDRRRGALLQKLLSDLTRVPLALDGVLGERTQDVAVLVASRLAEVERAGFLGRVEAGEPTFDIVARLWQQQFAAELPAGLPPRVCHDPALAFVFADFNSGRSCSRTAALQFLLNDLLGCGLAVDGKRGPRTAAAVRQLFETFEPDPDRRADFLALVDEGKKPGWTHEQAHAVAADLWRARHGAEPPRALVPDFWHGGFAQQLKGIGRISIEGYVAGSARFFEDYYARLRTYTGS